MAMKNPMSQEFPKEFLEAIQEELELRARIEKLMLTAVEKAPRWEPWTRGAKVVKRRKEGQKLFRKLVMDCKWPSISVNLIRVYEGGRFTVGSINIDGTIMNAFFDIRSNAPDFEGTTHNRFTEDAVKIRLVQPSPYGEPVDMTQFLNDAYILSIVDGEKCFFRMENSTGFLYDQEAKPVSDDMAKVVMAGAYKTYNLGNSQSDTTAGDRKKWQMTMLSDVLMNGEVSVADVKDVLTMGMSRLMITDGSKKGDIAKNCTRLTQQMAAMAVAGKILCSAHYFGKFPFADGECYFSDIAASRAVHHMSGGLYSVLPELLDGMAVQARPFGFKALMFVTSLLWILALIDALDPNPIILTRAEFGEAEMAYQAMAFRKEGPWYGHVVILCEDETIRANWRQFIQVVSDLNAEKAQTDYALPAYLNIMDISHESHDRAHGAKLSSQTLSKATFADFEMAKKWVLISAQRKYLEVVASWNQEATESVTSEDLADARTLLAKIAPDYIRFDRPSFDEQIKSELKSFNTALGVGGKICLSTHGEYRKGICDPMVDLLGKDYRILKVRKGVADVILPGSYKGWKYSTKFYFQRFPSISTRETMRGQIRTIEWYASEARKLGIAEDIIAKAIDMLKRASEGVIVLPASSLMLSALGGADFDGDGYILYFACIEEDSSDFERISIVEIRNIKSVEECDRLLLQAGWFFYCKIVPLAIVVPEY